MPNDIYCVIKDEGVEDAGDVTLITERGALGLSAMQQVGQSRVAGKYRNLTPDSEKQNFVRSNLLIAGKMFFLL